MCHVLSEGSKWSGWVRPCGLSPCAPRYYYSTPRCTLVYSLVLSSVCCASVWCCAPVLWCALCLACPACGVAAWCCVCGVRVRPNPALPAPVGVCYGVPCTPCVLPALFSWGNTCPIYGGAICGPCTLPIYVPYFFRLAIYDPFCTCSKSRPLDSECGFPKVGLNFRCSVFLFAEFSPVKFPA